MLKSYTVEYSMQFRKHSPPQHHQFYADDVVECETFIQELLERGMGLHAIKHEAADVPPAEFDRIVKVAAEEVAAKLVCTTLHIKPDEAHQRFGFST